MAPSGSVSTKWLPEFKARDERATSELWKRFFERIVREARRRLVALGVPRRTEDEEDVALSVFRRLCDMADKGTLGELHRTDDLWALLVTIAAGKVTDLLRRQTADKRGGGEVRGESAFERPGGSPEDGAGIQGFVAGGQSPEAQVMLNEELDRLLVLLPDPVTRRVAELYLQGEGKTKIAAELGVSRQVIYRKLDLILGLWRKEAADERV